MSAGEQVSTLPHSDSIAKSPSVQPPVTALPKIVLPFVSRAQMLATDHENVNTTSTEAVPKKTRHVARRNRPSHGRHSEARRRNATVASSLRFATFTLWVLATLTALTLGVVADVFQGERPQFPLGPVVATCVGLYTAAAALVLLLGKLSKRGYAVFQPFEGGQRFVVLQTGGYMLALTTAVGMALLVQMSPLPPTSTAAVSNSDSGDSVHRPLLRYGAYTVLSGLAAVAQLLLAASLLFFTTPPSQAAMRQHMNESENTAVRRTEERSKTTASAASAAPTITGAPSLPSLRQLAQSPARAHAFVALCISVMLLSAATAEVYIVYRPVSVAVVTCFVVVAVATIAHLGRLEVPTYRVLQHSSHGLSHIFLQLIGNSVLLLCFCGAVVLLNAGRQSPSSWHIGTALLGVVGVCSHLLLLHLTHARERQLAAAEEALAAVELDPSSPLLNILVYESERRADAQGSLYGAAMSTGVSIVLAGTVFGVSVVLSMRQRSTQEAEKPEDYVAKGLTQVQALIVVLMFTLPPFTHLQGRLAFGTGFAIWQPFRGSLDFVLLQAAGWACYSFGILFATLHVAEPPGSFNFLLVLTTLLVLCQLFVHISLLVFDDTKHKTAHGGQDGNTEGEPATSPGVCAESPTLVDGSRASVNAQKESDGLSPTTRAGDEANSMQLRALVGSVVNGEFLLALVLAIVTVLLRAVCDVAELWHVQNRGIDPSSPRISSGDSTRRALRIPVAALAHAATFLNLLATPIAQFSMHDSVPLWRMGSDSNGFDLLQTIAWLLYVVLFLTAVANLVTGERHYFMCSKEYLPAEYTAQGLVLSIPLVCVLVSSVCKAQDRARGVATTQRVVRAADALVSLLIRKDCDAAERRRIAELIRTVAGPRLAAADWGRELLVHVSCPTGDIDNNGAATSAAAIAKAAADEVEQERLREEYDASVSAARYVTAITWLATTAAFASAAFLVNAQPVITLLLGGAGILVLSLSCASLQLVLGRRLHGHTGRYAVFMPFVGGRAFVAWQAVGWASFTMVQCLMIACMVEGRGSRSAFFIMIALSTVAEATVLHSIPLFNAEQTAAGTSFVGRNAEGLLAAIIILGTFAFARAYDSAAEGGVASSASALVPVVMVSIAMCLTVPMGLLSLQRQAEHYGVSPFAVFAAGQDTDEDDEAAIEEAEAGATAMSSRAATPLTASLMGTMTTTAASSPPGSPTVSLHRRLSSMASLLTPAYVSRGASVSLGTYWDQHQPTMARDHVASPLWREASASLAGVRSRRRGSVSLHSIAISYAVSLLVALFLVLLLPFTVVCLAYSYMHNAELAYTAATRMLELLVAGFLMAVTIPMVVAPIAHRSRAVRRLHSALCAWSIYSIPTITVMSGISPPFFVQTRGSWLFAINMCAMALLSTIPYVHLIAFVFSLASCGYFAQYHLYECLYAHRASFVLWKCVADMVCAVFWLWYGRRYVGRPEITGRFQSSWATRFFQRHFFEGMSRWFSLKIIVADLYTLPSEQGVITLVHDKRKAVEDGEKNAKDEEGERERTVEANSDHAADALRFLTHRRHVDRSDPTNQYIFSFHPHGVFPGTALYAPKTYRFEKELGANAKNFISTHCADVVFSVPLMRELPLCLGSLSVSRSGIEHSIRAGNSPLIVTGGQSEMLLVQMSNTEMHLVCHHLGFVKLAMRNRIPLVPMLSFSECNIMDNVHCLSVQRWFLKRIGFPFPTLPYGFYKLPLPTATPMTLVVGPPIMPLPGRDNSEDPECQDELRIRYFQHVEYLFYRYCAAAGYPNMKLFLHHGVDDAGVLATPPAAEVRPEEYVLDEEHSAIRRALAAHKLHREAARRKREAAKEVTKHQ